MHATATHNRPALLLAVKQKGVGPLMSDAHAFEYDLHYSL